MLFFSVVLVSSLQALVQPVEDSSDYTTSWAVEIDGGSMVADRLAAAHGFQNRGQVNTVLFTATSIPTR